MTKTKFTALLLALLMICAAFASCGGDNNDTGKTTAAKDSSSASAAVSTTASASGNGATEGSSTSENTTGTETSAAVEDGTVRLGGLKGPTTIGMVKLLDDAENGRTGNKYEFTMATTADELTPALLKGELDILAAPVNLASVLYNKSEGKVGLAAVNTLGVLYIVEKGGETVKSLSDLKGKTLYATGKGTTPEFALNYLLSANGISMEKDLTVEWKSEPTEIVSLMATMETAYAMMPQPFVTVAQSKLSDLRIALDLTQEWDSLGTDSRLLTAGIIVRKEFAEKHPEQFKKFMEEYAASVKYVNENVKEAASLVEKLGIVNAAVAETAIPYCNLVCITGQDMQKAVDGYLGVLYAQKAESVGGKVPGDGFYISAE